MSDDDFVRRLRAMRDVPPWKMHLTFDAPLRVQRARRESSIGSSTVDVSWIDEYGLRQKLSRPIRCF